MQTKENIQQRLEWLQKALKDKDNQTMVQQCKLYAQIDLIKWILSN